MLIHRKSRRLAARLGTHIRHPQQGSLFALRHVQQKEFLYVLKWLSYVNLLLIPKVRSHFCEVLGEGLISPKWAGHLPPAHFFHDIGLFKNDIRGLIPWYERGLMSSKSPVKKFKLPLNGDRSTANPRVWLRKCPLFCIMWQSKSRRVPN